MSPLAASYMAGRSPVTSDPELAYHLWLNWTTVTRTLDDWPESALTCYMIDLLGIMRSGGYMRPVREELLSVEDDAA
jgi:hypothetical protein